MPATEQTYAVADRLTHTIQHERDANVRNVARALAKALDTPIDVKLLLDTFHCQADLADRGFWDAVRDTLPNLDPGEIPPRECGWRLVP